MWFSKSMFCFHCSSQRCCPCDPLMLTLSVPGVTPWIKYWMFERVPNSIQTLHSRLRLALLTNTSIPAGPLTFIGWGLGTEEVNMIFKQRQRQGKGKGVACLAGWLHVLSTVSSSNCRYEDAYIWNEYKWTSYYNNTDNHPVIQPLLQWTFIKDQTWPCCSICPFASGFGWNKTNFISVGILDRHQASVVETLRGHCSYGLCLCLGWLTWTDVLQMIRMTVNLVDLRYLYLLYKD